MLTRIGSLVIVLVALITRLSSIASVQAQAPTDKPKPNVAILIYDECRLLTMRDHMRCLVAGANGMFTLSQKHLDQSRPNGYARYPKL